MKIKKGETKEQMEHAHRPDYIHNPSTICSCSVDFLGRLPAQVKIKYCSIHAAAPELLSACKRARAELSSMHAHFYVGCDGGCPADDIEKQLIMAIAKAEGR